MLLHLKNYLILSHPEEPLNIKKELLFFVFNECIFLIKLKKWICLLCSEFVLGQPLWEVDDGHFEGFWDFAIQSKLSI